MMGSAKFINDADAFFDEKGSTAMSGNFTNLGTLEVGTASDLTLSNPGGGAVVDLENTIQLDGDLTLLGTVTSSLGFTEAAGGGTLKVGDGTAGSATLNIPSGVIDEIFSNLEVTYGSTLTGAGELSNSGKLQLDFGSFASPGSYVQTSSGTLEEQAPFAGGNTALRVAGNAQLSGTLVLDFTNGYTPKSGDSFTVLTAGSVGAHFDTTPDNMTMAYGPNGVSATEK